MHIKAYAAQKSKEPLQSFNYKSPILKDEEIEVAVTHCGICHSDVHLVDNDWNISVYPLVPGHEIIGTVHRLGVKVKNFQIGQRVGIGWQCYSCLVCEYCHRGEEHLCASSQGVAVGHHGGFADLVCSHERFVIPIPEQLSSEYAAPLLCGGITVYSPLRRYVTPNMRVGIIGIGGLGHLALQFARAFGCEVTAFSSQAEKKQDARRFGALHFVQSNQDQALKPFINYFDFILSTVNVDLNWEIYLQLLRPHGKLCFVGAGKRLNVSIGSLLYEKTICGSVIGNPLMIVEMLEFAARNHIQAQIQLLPMDQANEGLNLVRNSQAHYRIVLENVSK